MTASSLSACQPVDFDSAEMLYPSAMAMAIEETKAALVDDTQRTTDRTIAVIAQMAAYEALLGDREYHRMHMQGLKRIVRLRGGLLALGPSGLMKRFLLWIDLNTSLITGSPPIFEHNERNPPPDLKQFAFGCCCAINRCFVMVLPHIQ